MDQKLIERLRALTPREFVEVFYEVFAEQNARRDLGDGGFEIVALCLAECRFGEHGALVDASAEIRLVATPTPELAGVDWGNDLSQAGQCEICRARVVSVARGAICPVCRSEVDCQ